MHGGQEGKRNLGMMSNLACVCARVCVGVGVGVGVLVGDGN